MQKHFPSFCPELKLSEHDKLALEEILKRKFAPSGPCLLLIDRQLKLELILTSIDLGFGVLLMLLTWLFICRRQRGSLVRFSRQKQEAKNNSPVSTGRSSILSQNQQPAAAEPVKIPELPVLALADKPMAITKLREKHQAYSGYLSAVEDLN